MFLKRRGWSEAANTWEPVENLVQCSDVIDAFEERFSSSFFAHNFIFNLCSFFSVFYPFTDKIVDFVVFQS